VSGSRPLEALDAALGTVADDDFHHLSPPIDPPVATNKPLRNNAFRHFRHFRHLDRDGQLGVDPEQADAAVVEEGADSGSAIGPEVSLVEEKGGESGESRKTRAMTMTCASPPALAPVADGGEGGESRGPAAPDLLARLGQALRPRRARGKGGDGPDAASGVARRHDRLNRWLIDHPPAPCPPGRCAHCGGDIGERAGDALPVLRSVRPIAPVWLHLRCHGDWHGRRLAAADAALARRATGTREADP
jgi:hypothetical protein